MKKILFTILLFPLLGFSQIKSLKVTYGGIINTKSEELYDEKDKSEYKDLYESKLREELLVGKLNFQLLFNGRESLFFHPEYKSMEYDDFDSLLDSFNGDLLFYSINNDKLTYYKDFWGRELLVSSTYSEFIWTLENETKTIDGYLCYKAVGEEVYEDSKNIYKLKVIAWYSPKIPVKIGPLGYGNLPGLILELSVGVNTYFVKSISINPKDMTAIVKPTKGEKMDKKDFDKQSEQIRIDAKKAYQDSH